MSRYNPCLYPGVQAPGGASYGGSFLAFAETIVHDNTTFSGFIGSSVVFEKSKAAGLMRQLPETGKSIPYNLYLSYGEDDVGFIITKPDSAPGWDGMLYIDDINW